MVFQLDFDVTFLGHFIRLAHRGLVESPVSLLPEVVLPDSLGARSLGTGIFLIFPRIEFCLNYRLFIILLLLWIKILESLFY